MEKELFEQNILDYRVLLAKYGCAIGSFICSALATAVIFDETRAKTFAIILFAGAIIFATFSCIVHKYKNYKEYKKVQVAANKQKITYIFVDGNAIRTVLVPYILNNIPNPKFGICHGTRNGTEQQSFIGEFKLHDKIVDVLGTEISDTATNYPNTIEWDFHEVKDEWLGSVDFIYSNSFDHSYKPNECLDTWMSCLTKDGILMLEWTDCDINPREMDPTGGTVEEYKRMITAKYQLVDILENNVAEDSGKDYKGKRKFFIIKNGK